MKLIIDIKDEQYKAVQDGWWCGSLYEELKNGIPVEHCGDCISREKALQIIRAWFDREATPSDLKNEVEQLPSVTPQPCDDAVSRQAVLEAIDVKAWEFCDYLISKGRNDEQKPVSHFADNLRECVGKDLPSVTPQPEMGRWIDIMVGDIPAQACDKCNAFYPLAYTGGGHKFCPNCGRKMEVKDES